MRETNIQKQIKNLYNQLGTTQPVATYDPENWNHHLRMYAYNRDGNEIEEKGYYINSALSPAVFEKVQAKCSFKIPNLLRDLWLEQNGFYTSFLVDNIRLSFGLLPIQGAFDLKYDIDDLEQLLAYPLLDPELFESGLEFGFKDVEAVGIDGLMENCILLECFSTDLLSYTLYKLDHAETEQYDELYIVWEHGPCVLNLSLDQYLEAMFEFKGVVFAWPRMFTKEDNLDASVINEKHELIAKAKKRNEALNLGIDFKKYGL